MTTERPLLDHENLDVYRVAVEFLAFSLEVPDGRPRQRRELRSQLERMSIPLNIAEGAGKPSAADRARYYATARGSALEYGAALDVSALLRHASPDQLDHRAASGDLDRGKRMLSRIVAMLTRMCRGAVVPVRVPEPAHVPVARSRARPRGAVWRQNLWPNFRRAVLVRLRRPPVGAT